MHPVSEAAGLFQPISLVVYHLNIELFSKLEHLKK